VSGLNFGTYSQFSVITGKPNMRGIQVFGYGDLGSYSDLGDVYSIDVENMRLFSDDISATSWTGIKIRDGVGSGYFTSLPIQTQLDIDKPTSATGNNYQMVLQGGGVGSGIWFNGTTGQRVYSDGVTLNINSSLNISNTLNTNTISSSGNSNVTITSSGGSVIIKLG